MIGHFGGCGLFWRDDRWVGCRGIGRLGERESGSKFGNGGDDGFLDFCGRIVNSDIVLDYNGFVGGINVVLEIADEIMQRFRRDVDCGVVGIMKDSERVGLCNFFEESAVNCGNITDGAIFGRKTQFE